MSPENNHIENSSEFIEAIKREEDDEDEKEF